MDSSLIFIGRKKVIFEKNWLFLILIIVSTSQNKSCKILFFVGEIVFVSITVFFLLVVLFSFVLVLWYSLLVLLEIIGSQFLHKNFIAPCKNCFLASEKPFFSFIRYSNQWIQFLPREKFNEFSIPPGGNKLSV